MTASDIQIVLARHYFDIRRDAIFLNTHHGPSLGESDMVIVRPSGWVIEVEVKVSLSDFKADLEKGKNRGHDVGKHDRLALGNPKRVRPDGSWQDVLDVDDRQPHTCRNFWFAVPLDLLEKVKPQLPLHAGLLGVSHNKVVESAAAPNLKAGKIKPETLLNLYRSMYFKHWHRLFSDYHARLR